VTVHWVISTLHWYCDDVRLHCSFTAACCLIFELTQLILAHFVRRGTAGAQAISAGARAPAGPGLAPPLSGSPEWWAVKPGKIAESDRHPHPNPSPFCVELKQISVLLVAVLYGSLPPQGQYWAGRTFLRTTHLPIWPPMTYVEVKCHITVV